MSQSYNQVQGLFHDGSRVDFLIRALVEDIVLLLVFVGLVPDEVYHQMLTQRTFSAPRHLSRGA